MVKVPQDDLPEIQLAGVFNDPQSHRPVRLQQLRSRLVQKARLCLQTEALPPHTAVRFALHRSDSLLCYKPKRRCCRFPAIGTVFPVIFVRTLPQDCEGYIEGLMDPHVPLREFKADETPGLRRYNDVRRMRTAVHELSGQLVMQISRISQKTPAKGS